MTTTPIKFDRNATELPDRNGIPVRAGDWVRDIEGREWQVVELRPTEEHAPDNPAKGLGTLSLKYSYIDVQNYDSQAVVDLVRTMTFAGKVVTSRAPSAIERLDLSAEERRERELERCELRLRNLDSVQAVIRGKVREAERQVREAERAIAEARE